MRSRVEMVGSRATALTAMLLAVATALGYAEAVLLPALPVPGLKLGLANVAVVIALAVLGPARAAVVSVGRVFLVALATGKSMTGAADPVTTTAASSCPTA